MEAIVATYGTPDGEYRILTCQAVQDMVTSLKQGQTMLRTHPSLVNMSLGSPLYGNELLRDYRIVDARIEGDEQQGKVIAICEEVARMTRYGEIRPRPTWSDMEAKLVGHEEGEVCAIGWIEYGDTPTLQVVRVSTRFNGNDISSEIHISYLRSTSPYEHYPLWVRDLPAYYKESWSVRIERPTKLNMTVWKLKDCLAEIRERDPLLFG